MKSELVNQYSLFITSIFNSSKYRRTVWVNIATTHRETKLCRLSCIINKYSHYCTEHPLGFCILTVLLLYTEILVCVNQIFVYNTIELFYGEFANQKKGTWFIKLMKKMFWLSTLSRVLSLKCMQRTAHLTSLPYWVNFYFLYIDLLSL